MAIPFLARSALCGLLAITSVLGAPAARSDDLPACLATFAPTPFYSLIAQAAAMAADAGSFCRSCAEDEIQEVSLELAGMAREDLDPLWMASEDSYFFQHAAPSTPRIRQRVRSVEEIRGVLERLAGDCRRIRSLSIFSHGDSAGILLGKDGWLDRTSLENAFPAGSECLFRPKGSISLSGCNVARGCKGTSFLATFGRRLLRRGGTIAGNTYYSSTPLPGLVPHFSLNLDTQELDVDSTGRITSASSETCRDEMQGALDFFDQQDSRTETCVVTSPELEAYRAARDRAREAYEQAAPMRGNDLDVHAVNLNHWSYSDWADIRFRLARATTEMSEAIDRSGCEPYGDAEGMLPF